MSTLSRGQQEPAAFFTEQGSEQYSDYHKWVDKHGAEYQNAVFLGLPDSQGDGMAVHWTIDESKSKLQLAFAAKASGWVGFGIAEAGQHLFML